MHNSLTLNSKRVVEFLKKKVSKILVKVQPRRKSWVLKWLNNTKLKLKLKMAYCITQHLFDLVYSMFSCVVSPVNRIISDEFALGIILDSVSSILPTGDDRLTSLPKETSFVLFLICILCFLRSAKVPLPFMVTTTCTVTYFVNQKKNQEKVDGQVQN